VDAPHRPGITASDFPPVFHLLSRKNPKKYKVLVGSDPAQIRFAEQALGLKCRFAEAVDDSTLLTGEPCLLCITAARVVDLSASVREKAAFWSIGPVRKGSAAALALVKHAALLLGKEGVDREVMRRCADALAFEDVDDVRVAIWNAVWLLLGPVPAPYRRWPGPWEDSIRWIPPGVDPAYRLHALFKDLSAYAFVLSGEEESLRKAGLSVSPSRLKYLKGLSLDPSKVHDTVREISAWRMRRGDPHLAALRVSAIWQR